MAPLLAQPKHPETYEITHEPVRDDAGKVRRTMLRTERMIWMDRAYVFLDKSASPQYVGEWAFSPEGEKAIFESFVDFAIARWSEFPDFHIYHYAPYEPAALKRLMGRYGTREDVVDQMLRANLFVDLYSVVKKGIRASVESYSIKRLEPLYGYERITKLSEANQALANLQAALELNDIESIDSKNKDAFESYNRDDCLSTGLRNWLERVRYIQ